MAWPQTRLLDFIDNSTPYVSAAFLNAIQDEINAARAESLRLENWNYAAATPIGGSGGAEGWVQGGVGVGATLTREDARASFPFAHILMTPPPADLPASLRLESRAPLWFADAAHSIVLETRVQRAAIGAADFQFSFGTGIFGGFLASQLALFEFDSLVSANWRVHTHDGVAIQTTVTGTAFPVTLTARVKLRIEIAGTTAVRFYINDVLVATHSTRVPINAALSIRAVASRGSPGTVNTMRFGPVAYGTRQL